MDWFIEEKIGTEKKEQKDAILLQFYRFSLKETCFINGTEKKKEIKKIFHITYLKPSLDGYTAIVETFNRVEKNREASVSGKIFTEKLASVRSTLELHIDNYGLINRIKNMDLVRDKRKKQIDRLSKKYIGQYAERSLDAWDRLYNNEQLLILFLKKYDELGLFFHPFYKQMQNRKIEENQLRYMSFLDHTLIYIKEKVLDRFIDEPGHEKIHLTIGGEIVDPLYITMLDKSMELQKIPFDKQKDAPRLETYDGYFVLNNHTSRIYSTLLNIVFTYGKYYKKNIQYKLEEISHEEI